MVELSFVLVAKASIGNRAIIRAALRGSRPAKPER